MLDLPARDIWLDDASATLAAYAQLASGTVWARRAAARRLLRSPNVRPVLERAALTSATREAVLDIARFDTEDRLDGPWTRHAEAWMELIRTSWQESAVFCSDLAWSGRKAGSSPLIHLTAEQVLSGAPAITARARLHLYAVALRYDFRCATLRELFARRGRTLDLDPFSRAHHAFALLGQSDPAGLDLIDPLLEESADHPAIAHTLLHGLWLGHDLPDQAHRMLSLLERSAFDADTDSIALFRKAAALRRLRWFDEALAAITQAMEYLPVDADAGVHSDLVRERALILLARES